MSSWVHNVFLLWQNKNQNDLKLSISTPQPTALMTSHRPIQLNPIPTISVCHWWGRCSPNRKSNFSLEQQQWNSLVIVIKNMSQRQFWIRYMCIIQLIPKALQKWKLMTKETESWFKRKMLTLRAQNRLCTYLYCSLRPPAAVMIWMDFFKKGLYFFALCGITSPCIHSALCFLLRVQLSWSRSQWLSFHLPR